MVRVAPRPKNPATAYNYNLANSFPATFPANFYPNNSNFPNFTVNTVNYPNYPNDIQPPSTVGGNGAGGGINGSGVGNAAPAALVGNHHPLAFNPFLVKNSTSRNGSKQFNSLKSTGPKKSPQFFSMRVNKCQRHHSFVAEPQQQLLLINNTRSMPYISQHSKLKNHDQPLYENLTDSIQIHESSMQNESSFASVLDEFNCEPERYSIYRSDSGISNSSYECITPVPAPRSTNQRNCQSAPVYMNLPNSSSSSSSQTQQQHQQQPQQRGHHSSVAGRCASTKGGSKGGCRTHHQVKHNGKCKTKSQNGNAVDGGGNGAFYSYEVCV